MNRAGKLHALLSTARIANVPSVVCNVWVGVAAAWMMHPAGFSYWNAGRLAFAGVFLYISGNFLNDWMDRDWDRSRRPERALPSGLFTPSAYLAAGVLLAVLGLALAFSVSQGAGRVAAAIIVCVVIYTWIHKQTAWSVIPMGLCRALLPAMGADGFSQSWNFSTLTGLALFCYIVGLSLSARSEAVVDSSRINKFLSLVLFILAPSWVTVTWCLVDECSWKMIAALMAYLVWIALAVSWFRKPVSRHVSALLAGIPLLDWIFLLPLLTASFSSFGLACAFIPPVAFISALLLQRLAPAT
jgi:4-hydroxybenzoate polyprenyltransferase